MAEGEVLWSLQDSWSSEQVWSEGRIELKREEFDDKLYRVNTPKYYALTIRVHYIFEFQIPHLHNYIRIYLPEINFMDTRNLAHKSNHAF